MQWDYRVFLGSSGRVLGRWLAGRLLVRLRNIHVAKFQAMKCVVSESTCSSTHRSGPWEWRSGEEMSFENAHFRVGEKLDSSSNDTDLRPALEFSCNGGGCKR